ncbi:MAG: hypothetical protein QM778_18700 [Myxococcales bacterium]
MASFSWEETEALPVPEPTGKVTKSTVDDLQATMPIYYVQVYVTEPEHLRELEEMGVHYDATPLFDSEQAPDDEYIEDFTGSDTDGGFYVYALMPAQVYNGIRDAALGGEFTYKAVQLRQAPAAALNADGTVSWSYLADNLLVWAPPTMQVTDTGDAPLDATLAGDPVGTVVNEYATLNLACPTGETIVDVPFASYGTPTGSYPDFALSTCDASNSRTLVANACVGKTSCSVFADNSVFGDPCVGTDKKLAVSLTCEGPDTKRFGRRLRKWARKVRDAGKAVVDAARTAVGKLVTAVLPTSDVTVQFHVGTPGSTYTAATRAWGDAARFGKELTLSKTRITTTQFGRMSLYPGTTDDSGLVKVTVRRDRKTRSCIEMDSAGFSFEAGFIRVPRHCFTFTPNSATPAPYSFSTSDKNVFQLAQFIDARKFAAEAFGYTPKKATVQTGKLANALTAASDHRAFTPCLAARKAPNSMVNSYADALVQAGALAGAPFVGITASIALEFAYATDIVLPDATVDSRNVAAHEYGHFVFCDLLANESMQTYNVVWSQVVVNAMAKSDGEVNHLNEGFADWYSSQVMGGTSYVKNLDGSGLTVAGDAVYWSYTTPGFTSGMESNVGHRNGPVVNTYDDNHKATYQPYETHIARVATLFHDVGDGKASDQGPQLTTDTGIWSCSAQTSDTFLWTGCKTESSSTWNNATQDEEIQLTPQTLRDAIKRFATSNGPAGASLSNDNLFSALSTELRYKYNDAQVCQLYSLHSTDGCPASWDGNRPKTLTVKKAGNGTGTVTAPNPLIQGKNSIDCGSDCTETLNNGATVTLTATPTSGQLFGGWSGGGCPPSVPTCTVTMSAAQTVTATFKLQDYSVNVSKTGNGTGTVSATGINCGSDCTELYPAGTVVTLTATPAASSNFTGWSGACTGTSSTCTVTVSAAKSVTANFALKTFTVTVVIKDMISGGTNYTHGTVSGPSVACPGDCTTTVNYGASITLKNTNTSDFIDSWSTTGSSGCKQYDDTCTFPVTANKTVTVTFGTIL